MAGYLDKWQATADDLLAVLLVKSGAWLDAVDVGVTDQDMPVGAWRSVYNTVIELRGEHLKDAAPSVLTDTEVATRAGGGVTVEFVAERIALYDQLREATFSRTCTLLRSFGRGHRQIEVLRRGLDKARAMLEDGRNLDITAGEVVDGLQAEQVTDHAEPIDIGDLADAAEERLKSEPCEGLRTGVWLIDNWLRGIAPGELVVWVAPYKMRKTSVMANVLINVASQGKQVNVFSFDESRQRFYHRLMACKMAQYMFEHDLWHAIDEHANPLNVVDGKMIANAGNRWHLWAGSLQRAREYARDELTALRGRVRVYDLAVAQNTMLNIRALSRIDAMKHGGLDMIMVDHITRLADWKETYEQAEYGSAALHDLGGELDAVMWALSQQNEAAIKGHDEGSWSPNAKGGGGIASNADTVMLSKYRVGTVTDPNYLRLELRLAREADAPRYGYVEIHPASGWITPREVDVKKFKIDPETLETIPF